MTALMEEAVERLRSISEERQDAVARLVMLVAGNETDVDLTDEDLAAIEKSRAAAARGEFASDRDMRDLKTTFGL